MNTNKCLQVSDADFSINNFIDKDFVSSALKESILSSSILFLPLLDFRESGRPLFYDGTSDFYNYCTKSTTEKVEICIDDDKYEEIALCCADVNFGDFLIIGQFALDIFTSILSSYIYDRIVHKKHQTNNREQADQLTISAKPYLAPPTVSFEINVKDSISKKSKKFSYEGPASEVPEVMEQIKEMWNE